MSQFDWLFLPVYGAPCIAKNILRFYGKITGNQLLVHFPFCFVFLRAPVNIFMNQAQYGSKETRMALGHIALIPKWYFGLNFIFFV